MSNEKKNGKNNSRNGSRNGYKPKKSGSNSRGSSPRGDNGSTDRVDNRTAGTESLNHDSWYNKFPTLVRAYASIPFTNPQGAYLPEFTGRKFYVPNGEADAISTPGIMVFDTIPNPGVSKDTFSPVNVASGAFYTEVRYKMSGQGTYDRADLMMYILAVDSSYTLWAEAVRAYATMMTYSFNNRYLARYLVEALGYDFDDLSGQLPRFRGLIDEFAGKIAQFNIPKSFDYVTRHIWQYGNIFKDGPSAKAQLYAFKPHNYWKFEELKDIKGSKCLPIARPTKMTLTDLENIMVTQFNALYYSSTMMNAAGDIGKALGSEAMLKVAYIQEFQTAPIQHDERTLMEIQNMSIFPVPDEDTNFIQVDNDVNAIVYDPKFLSLGNFATDYADFTMLPLNVRIDNPTPQDVMKATRMTAFMQPTADGSAYEIRTSGTELCVGAKLYYLFTLNGEQYMDSHEICSAMDTNSMRGLHAVHVFADLAKFDYHPYVYYFATIEEDKSRACLAWNGDVDNVTFVDPYTLDKIHEAAIMSEYFSKGMGNFVLD